MLRRAIPIVLALGFPRRLHRASQTGQHAGDAGRPA